MRFLLSVAAVLCGLLTLACGGGDTATTTSAARELREPRTVPSATVPAQPPTTIAALDLGQPSRRPTALPDVYIVKAGDTPAGIAAELGVPLSDLLRVNGIDDPRALKVGQQLKVPRPSPTATRTPAPGAATASATRTASPSAATATPARTGTPAATPPAGATATAAAGGTYTVQAGDTACAIAQKLGVPLTALAEANGTTVAGLASLAIGQILKVPSTRGPAGC